MSDPDELALVVKALKGGLGGSIEWDDEVIDRIRREMIPHQLTAAIVRKAVIAFVQEGGVVRQVTERRPEWKAKRRYYYKVILPAIGSFKKGLFVEMELIKPDPELPEVRLVNAHEQT